MNPFNPENLKLKPSPNNRKAAHIPSRKIKSALLNRGEKFLKGPIPLIWLTNAAKLPGRALHVGISLWYLSGLKKTHEVKLTNVVLAKFGVKKDAKRRGLEALEEAGLVSIKRRKNKNPIVTILKP
jgi:hypothetical protein